MRREEERYKQGLYIDKQDYYTCIGSGTEGPNHTLAGRILHSSRVFSAAIPTITIASSALVFLVWIHQHGVCYYRAAMPQPRVNLQWRLVPGYLDR